MIITAATATTTGVPIPSGAAPTAAAAEAAGTGANSTVAPSTPLQQRGTVPCASMTPTMAVHSVDTRAGDAVLAASAATAVAAAPHGLGTFLKPAVAAVRWPPLLRR